MKVIKIETIRDNDGCTLSADIQGHGVLEVKFFGLGEIVSPADVVFLTIFLQ